MRNASVGTLVFALLLGMSRALAAQDAPTPQGKTFKFSEAILRGYHDLQQDLAAAAEKMPDEHYGFKPTPEIRPFGQLIAHVALAQFRTCAMLKSQPNPRKDDKEDATRTKADEIALLKESTVYCDPVVSAVNDTTIAELANSDQIQVAKGLIPVELVAHGMEMYGTMAVYLRLKGIVPPTTERQMKMQKGK